MDERALLYETPCWWEDNFFIVLSPLGVKVLLWQEWGLPASGRKATRKRKQAVSGELVWLGFCAALTSVSVMLWWLLKREDEQVQAAWVLRFAVIRPGISRYAVEGWFCKLKRASLEMTARGWAMLHRMNFEICFYLPGDLPLRCCRLMLWVPEGSARNDDAGILWI